MNIKHDWKKSEKQFYLPGNTPQLVQVPAFRFFTIKGQGNPNDSFFGDYISVLYSLSYAIKMSPKKGKAPSGYFDYSVYPLEGIWDITEEAKRSNQVKLDKSTLVFNLMIRQPDFVTIDFANEIIENVRKKKADPLLEKVKFETIVDGKCIQMLHTGSFDSEPGSFSKMEEFCKAINLSRESKVHREIYLSDARKTAPERLRTILRFRVV